MKSAFKILPVFLLVISSFIARAQSESLLQPFWNPVLLNPGFAGLDKTTSFRSGNQYYHLNDLSAYNVFYATYDAWSDKLRGGIAVNFKQGIIGEQNISTTEIGFGYAGYPMKTKNGEIRFSASTDFLMANKQWWVYVLDGILLEESAEPNPPGKAFMQYTIVKPRLGFLWNIETITWGITAAVPLKMGVGTRETEADPEKTSDSGTQFNLSFYLAKKSEGYKKGLHSLPFRLNPELMVFYQNDFLLSRLRVYVENRYSTIGMFVQNDFTHKMHTLGGTLGLARGYTRLDMSAGVGIPGLSENVGFCAEIGLHLTIPQIDYGRRNPWAAEDE